jgi:hypothetical protein
MSTQRAIKAPGVLVALAALAAVDIAVRTGGIARALALADRVSAPPSGRAADDGIIGLTAHRVATAAAFYPRRARCLEQSLALFILLRRIGVAADLKLGAQTLPFYAHAWIEVDGRPINESAGRLEQLVAFQQVSS